MYQPRDQFQALKKYGIEIGTTTLSVERAVDIVRRQWPLIASVVAGTLALVVIYLMVSTPMYTANARILMDTRQTQVLDKETAHQQQPYRHRICRQPGRDHRLGGPDPVDRATPAIDGGP